MPDLEWVIMAGCRHRECLPHLLNCFLVSFRRTDRTDLERTIVDELEAGHHYLLAYLGGQVQGFVSWRVYGEPRHRLAELYHIGVRPDNSRPGLGRQLVAAMVTNAQVYYQDHGHPGVRKVIIMTHADNIRAHNLYRRCGFTEIARLTNFFHAGLDELVFAQDYPDQPLA